jgi:hypothetical protein
VRTAIQEPADKIKWKLAKTYADAAPHEYLLRHEHPEVFEYYRAKLRTHGVREQFTLRGRTSWYRYYYEGPYKFWIIPPVLNRAFRES